MQRSYSGSHVEHLFSTPSKLTNPQVTFIGTPSAEPEPEYVSRPLDDARQWEELWQELVSDLVQVVEFPPFLVRDSETARQALRRLTADVCRIALNPQESDAYKALQKKVEQQEKVINELRRDNDEAKEALRRMSESRDQELTQITGRIEKFERMVMELRENKLCTDELLQKSLTKILTETRAEAHKQRQLPKPKHPKPTPTKSKLDFDEMEKNVQDTQIQTLIQKYIKPIDPPPEPEPPSQPKQTLFERSINRKSPKTRKKAARQRRV